MKILVVDDNKEYREFANQQLGNSHELTFASNAIEALSLLRVYDSVEKDNKEFNDVEPPFDVVLTDLFMPYGGIDDERVSEMLHEPEQGLQELPYGTIIALLAMQNRVDKIAIVTDASRHHSPVSLALDRFRAFQCYYNPVKVIFAPYMKRPNGDKTKDLMKDWQGALEELI